MKSIYTTSLVLLGAISVQSSPLNTYKRPCTQAEVALATGIHLNINAQQLEYLGTLKVEQVELANPSGPTSDFYLAKGMLEADVAGGIAIRHSNQDVAPPGNPAIPGLQQYQAAQETEQSQVQNLTGVYATDAPVLAQLKTEIPNGIALNVANMQAVGAASPAVREIVFADRPRLSPGATSPCFSSPANE